MKISQNIKIGITSKSGDNLFGNGLNQNVWFLFRLLKVAGYDIHLVSEDPKEQGKNLITEIIEPLSSDNIDTFGMIIECAHALSNSMTDLILDRAL